MEFSCFFSTQNNHTMNTKEFSTAQKEYIVRQMQMVNDEIEEKKKTILKTLYLNPKKNKVIPKYVYWQELYKYCTNVHQNLNTWETFRMRVGEHVNPFYAIPLPFQINKRDEKPKCSEKHSIEIHFIDESEKPICLDWKHYQVFHSGNMINFNKVTEVKFPKEILETVCVQVSLIKKYITRKI